MARHVTCESRDARKYCESWVSVDPASQGYFWSEEKACRQNLCTRILHDDGVWENSEAEPVFFNEDYLFPGIGESHVGTVQFWIFKNRIFEENHGSDFSLEERKLLILDEFDRERQQFEKLHAKFSGIPNATQSRPKIPSNVRIFVWQRDSGKSVECGSNENLEYDHIIPFVKGGSNTERNLQLLCGNCNRLKSDNIQ